MLDPAAALLARSLVTFLGGGLIECQKRARQAQHSSLCSREACHLGVTMSADGRSLCHHS